MIQLKHGESPAEFFGYKKHPFADTYRLKTPYPSTQDKRIYKTGISLISTGKSFALSGPSGTGKSTLIHYILSRLDMNCYRPALVHYGGLLRNCILKAIADVLGVDTAGRLHTQKNLMEELKKIKRSINKKLPGAPHDVLMVLDATTGQNSISQSNLFNEAVGLTQIALTKLDGTAKGGIVAAIASSMNLPIKYIGVGEQIEDLQEFDPTLFINALFD